MTRQHPELPHRVFPKGKWYYLVTADGKRRVWTKLTEIRAGLPALYRKLADIAADDVAPDRMPALIATWQDEVQPTHAENTQRGDELVMSRISDAFAEFRAGRITTPDCAEFLKQYRDRPRTHNLMRTGLQSLMRLAELKGFRPAGSNPVTAIAQMKTPPRKKYVTDSELRRIKHAALVGRDGLRTPSGPTICAMIDMAYLTGQRIGDLLQLRWNKKAAQDASGDVVAPYIGQDGIFFQPDKTAGTTGAKVLIGWTPRLRELVKRIQGIGRKNVRWVFTKQDAQPYTYDGFSTAWDRAKVRAGVRDCHFHDIRAKAITDTEESHGMQAARRKGAHSTEAQTADYVRHRKAQKSDATR